MILFLASVAHAAGSKLFFSDVDVEVGSRTSKNLEDGETIDDEAEPGDTVEFRIEVQSNFTNAENLDIEDITVEVTIEEIDDGDDFEDESSDFDLSPGRDKRVTVQFEVPLEVDEDTFDVIIRAEGEDENGTDHTAEMRLKLEVNKETHMLQITRNTLNPAEVACNRRNVQVGVTVINIGNEDEEDVSIQILNPDLEVDIDENIGELEAEPNEDTSKFSKTYSFSVPNGAESGSYPITVRALYDDDRRKAEETMTLTVNDCGTTEPIVDEEEEEQQAEEDEDVMNGGSDEDQATTVVVQQIPPDTTVTTEGFFKSNGFIVAIIVAEIIAVVVGIILIVTLVARRE